MVCPPETTASAAQIPEHGGKAVAGADGKERRTAFSAAATMWPLASPVFQRFLNGVQIVGALGLPARRPASSAWVRIFSILASSSVPYFWDSVRAHAGDVGVDVNLEGLVVLADHQAVADAVEVSPQGHPGRYPHEPCVP